MSDQGRSSFIARARHSWIALSVLGAGSVAALWWNDQVTRQVPVPFMVPPQVVPVPDVAPPPPQVVRVPSTPIRVTSVDDLKAVFDGRRYTIDAVRTDGAQVPRLIVANIPDDLRNLSDVDERKALFIRMMLPLVLISNERIKADRVRLETIAERMESGEALQPAERAWLQDLSTRYGTDAGNLEALLLRVDIVPPALALAQGAVESGWGTSRFARQGNALFGQWTTSNGDGLVPSDRDPGRTHKIRRFNSPLDAVEGYMRNLNTHNAYREFREIRSDMRTDGRPLNSTTLAGELESYSEKGNGYIKLIRHIIQFNGLKELNGATLMQPQSVAIGA